MKINVTAFALVVSLLSPALAQARMGQEGNGGDAVRLDIVSVRNYIYQNCDQWQVLKDELVDAAKLRAKIDQVGVGTARLRIVAHVDLGDGVSRDARNRPAIPDITFSRPRWLASGSDMPKKVGIELHEFLGLMGIEKTDDYHISSKLVLELRQESDQTKTTCTDFSGVWMPTDAAPAKTSGVRITQNGCQSIIETSLNPDAGRDGDYFESTTFNLGNISTQNRSFQLRDGAISAVIAQIVTSDWSDDQKSFTAQETDVIKQINMSLTYNFQSTKRYSLQDGQLYRSVKFTTEPKETVIRYRKVQ